MSRVKGWGTGLGWERWLDNTPSHVGPALGVVVARKHARRRRSTVCFQPSQNVIVKPWVYMSFIIIMIYFHALIFV